MDVFKQSGNGLTKPYEPFYPIAKIWYLVLFCPAIMFLHYLTIVEFTPPQSPLSEVIGTRTIDGSDTSIGAFLCIN